MNINRITLATIISGADQNKNDQQPISKKTSNMPFNQKGVKVKLTRQISNLLGDNSNDVNSLSVAHVKEQLEKGNFSINSDKIADALVKDIIDFS
ncbi:TPA: flagellar biosynthesis anti-sigma factor FlgM [Salmonella enterica subsp. enterica serovar Muenchen]|nr:hypothetical protein [Salmonella enterica]EJH1054340.1 flagellar biosynthesis anti-sigma factor FlgM [Salmonella enterica]HEC7758645.1 flagellar biosynthesis anti-sigma factor FlgM [Salmonella enterica subsp. enterica serovar Muenchen]HEC8860541.1 flagellar biosynthesis anti-sigma factor FlgM [Salmonella enterica subsp. enterica serovar Muenchen]